MSFSFSKQLSCELKAPIDSSIYTAYTVHYTLKSHLYCTGDELNINVYNTCS